MVGYINPDFDFWVHPREILRKRITLIRECKIILVNLLMHRYMEQMHEIVLSRNRFRDGAMVGRAMRAVKTLKKLDLSENEMTDLRQVGWMC